MPDQTSESLGMSDEDFLSTTFEEPEVTDVEETPSEQNEEAEAEEIEETSDSDAEPETIAESEEETSEEPEEESDSEEEPEADVEEDSTDTDETPEPEDSVDYQAQYEELMTPFKANGKSMQVKSIDEARKLMSMGAGFNKKMQALKPARLLQKKLEAHGLLEEGKLDFLIDLDKKNPEAIAKLIKDANIDPLNLDVTKDSSYQPEAYTGNAASLELDDVLDEIRSSDSFDSTVDVITNKWDESSRRTLGDHPQIISIINGHMENGVYDKISERVERERNLGSYMGVSDLEAYRQVAEVMNQEGAFTPPKEIEQAPVITAPVKKKKIDPNLKRKKATATTKSAPPQKATIPSTLNMSDEEIMKLDASQFN